MNPIFDFILYFAVSLVLVFGLISMLDNPFTISFIIALAVTCIHALGDRW